MLDSTTPREVYVEFEARKCALGHDLTPHQWADALERIADELGLGLVPDLLSAEQREAQARAIATWGGRCEP